MAKNSNLHTAKKEKNDEFYTQLTDIEKELKHYKKHFKGKTVYCNCDDCFESNFFKYFALNFNTLGLKKLITTCYAESQVSGTEFKKVDLWGIDTEEEKPVNNKKAYKIEINVVDDFNNDGQIDIKDIVESLIENKKNTLTILNGNGSYDSEECIALLKESDIVVTNPPFSLFRDYVATLMKYKKKFLIIGNMNAVTYKEIFPLFKDNKMWFGASIHSGDREFQVPDSYPLNASGCRVDENGKKYIRVKGVRWFTNINHSQRNEELILYKKYTKKEYPKYDNYDAINVDVTKDIPCDYNDVMDVPITFLDKYNPKQFEIIDINPHFFSLIEQGLPKPKQLTLKNAGRKKDPYARILIKRKVD